MCSGALPMRNSPLVFASGQHFGVDRNFTSTADPETGFELGFGTDNQQPAIVQYFGVGVDDHPYRSGTLDGCRDILVDCCRVAAAKDVGKGGLSIQAVANAVIVGIRILWVRIGYHFVCV